MGKSEYTLNGKKTYTKQKIINTFKIIFALN